MVLTGTGTSLWGRKRWLPWVVGLVLAVLVVLAVTIDVAAHQAEPFMRAYIVEALTARFHARVELDSFHLSLGNSLRGEWGAWAQGKGLRVWPPAQVEGVNVPGPPVEPLIRLGEFRFHAPLYYRPGVPVHVSQVRLKNLVIQFPPRSHFQHSKGNIDTGAAPRAHPLGVSFQVDSIECTEARLALETDKPGKLPLEFAIAHFKVTDVASDAAMSFEAELTNPRPPGAIQTKGSFGPWNVADPGESPIKGDYRFDRADLASFKGIAGILSSTGSYQGTLRDMTVDGETNTPDFRLTHFGNAMALQTRFHARVDGTNGDTWLQPVDATLGRSHFTAQGQVVRVLATDDGGHLHSIGHDIALTVNVDRARIEDFLHLASRTSTPLLNGNVTMKAALHIPPGQAPVHERLTLKGRFALDEAQFASPTVQDRIRELSLRGQGRPGDVKTADPSNVKSHMEGDFQMGGGMLKLPSLAYKVPGADIQLHGTYHIEGGGLDFSGTAKLQATISQIVGGWKGKLLKPADRFFKKDGAGTEIPIHISGTREKPEFGYDFRKVKGTKPERPGEKQ